MLSKPNTVEHLGNIIEVTTSNIRISIISHSACSTCHAKGACNMSESVEKILDYKPTNQHFSVGEQVKIILKQSAGLKAALMAYIIPFIILLVGLIIFKSINFSDGLAGLLSIVLIVPYFIILYRYRDELTKTFSFDVEKIIK